LRVVRRLVSELVKSTRRRERWNGLGTRMRWSYRTVEDARTSQIPVRLAANEVAVKRIIEVAPRLR